MVITFRQKQKKKKAFCFSLQTSDQQTKFNESPQNSVSLRAHYNYLQMLVRFLLLALHRLSNKVFRYSGNSELQNSNHFHISMISIIKLLNNSSYFLHSYDDATTTAATDDDTDTDDDDDTLSTSKGVKSFSLRRLLSFSLPAVR